MAITDSLSGTISTKVWADTDVETTSGSPVEVKLSSTTLYSIQLTNASSSTTTYLKFYDSAGAVTVGTTAPVLTIPVKSAYADNAVTISTGGLVFANGLQYTTDTSGGGTAGSTNPSDALTVKLVFS